MRGFFKVKIKNNNMSKDLMLIISSVMPESIILDKLEEAVKEHKLLNTQATKDSLSFYCMMILSKEVADKHGVEKIMKETDEVFAIRNRLNNDKQ